MGFERVEIGNCTLYRGDAFEVLPTLPTIGHIITDPPYSARTHRGHDALAGLTAGDKGYDGANRKALGYEPWDADTVNDFVTVAHKACSGWLVCMTDHTLAPSWHHAMNAVGRYVFAPLPYYAPGSRCRLSGDGPSSWTDWIIVSRTAKQLRWGTLPGGYSPTPNYGKHEHMGGKPLGLMLDLVRDYSRRGDLVCDPCMGSGTTAIACLRLGRPFIGIEKNLEFFHRACRRIEQANGKGTLFESLPSEASLFSSKD